MLSHSLVKTSCRRLSLALTAAVVTFAPAVLQGAITPSNGAALVWDPNPEADVTGYKIYVGSESGNYSTVLDVSSDTRAVLPQVNLGSTLYLAVSAVNAGGAEGPKSDELVVTADVPAPAASTSLAMTSPGEAKVQWKYPRNAAVSADRFTVYTSEDLVNWTPASDVLISNPSSSDAEWLYFDFPYTADKPRLFFSVGAANAFGEIR